MPSIPLDSKLFDIWELAVPWHSTQYWTLWSLLKCVLTEWNQLTTCGLHKALVEVYWLHFSTLWDPYLLRKDPCSNRVNLAHSSMHPRVSTVENSLTGQKFLIGCLMPSWLRDGCFPSASNGWWEGPLTHHQIVLGIHGSREVRRSRRGSDTLLVAVGLRALVWEPSVEWSWSFGRRYDDRSGARRPFSSTLEGTRRVKKPSTRNRAIRSVGIMI